MARILYFSRQHSVHDQRFLEVLSSSGMQVFSLCLEHQEATADSFSLPSGVTQVPWEGIQGEFQIENTTGLLPDLERAMKAVSPDVVHAGPIQRSAFLTALLGFRPLVTMSWGYDLIVDAERNDMWRWATQFTLKRSSVLIGDSKIVRDRATALGMDTRHIVTFPWGTDLQHFTPTGADGDLVRETYGWPSSAFVVLCNRAWEPLYGVDIVARAFVVSAQRHPELRLLLIGGGSQEDELRAIFYRGQVIDQVEFVGRLAQADLPTYYRATDLYISASHSDGASISLLEALACGVPVLVSDIPGNAEWVKPGDVGWLFADGDSEDLTDKLCQTLESSVLLRAMSKRARKLAEERADWSAHAQTLIETYDSILGTSG